MGANPIWREIPPPRRRRAVLVPAAGFIAVVGLIAVAIWFVGHRNATHAPTALVRAYAADLAAGRAEAAGTIVAPVARGGANIEPALLSDATLGTATQRIVIDEVSSYNEDETVVGGAADVAVSYLLAGQRNRVDLSVERLPNTFGVFRHWRLRDSLALPVTIETNIPEIPVGRIGSVTIPTSGPATQKYPQRTVLIYPGIYRVTGVDSPWVTAGREIRVDDNTSRLVSSVGPTAQVWYQPTAALRAKVATELAAQLRACAEAGRDMDPRRCPRDMSVRSDFGRLTITQIPQLSRLEAYQSDYRADGSTLPMLRFITDTGEFRYAGGAGIDPGAEDFIAQGGVTISPDGSQAQVQLWSSLSGPGE